MANDYNSVPQGRAGTGAAFVLPESRALGTFLDSQDYNRKMGLLGLQQKEKRRQELNKSYRDNALKAQNGMLFNGELNGIVERHIRKGADYRNQGFDVYNPDPNRQDQMAAYEDYMAERAKIQSMMDLRKSHEEHYKSQLKAAQDGSWDEDSVNALHEFYQDNGTRLQDIFESGTGLPTLQKRFDETKFLQGIKGTSRTYNTIKDNVEQEITEANPAAIRQQIEAGLLQNPQGKRWLEKQLGFQTADLLGTTDPAEIQKYQDDYYRSPEGAKEALQLFAGKGKVPSYESPEYQSFIQKKTQEQLQRESRYEQLINGLTLKKAAEVNTKNKVGYNFDLENQAMRREDQAMQRSNHAMTRQRFNQEQQDRTSAPLSRDAWIKGLQAGQLSAMDDLKGYVNARSGAVEVDGKKVKVGKVTYENDGQTLVVEYVGKDGKVRKEIDLRDGNKRGTIELNELLSDLTGQKVTLDKLQNNPYKGSVVDVGDVGLTSDQAIKLRDRFDGQRDDLMKFLYTNKKKFGIKDWKSAQRAANEILATGKHPKTKGKIVQ